MAPRHGIGRFECIAREASKLYLLHVLEAGPEDISTRHMAEAFYRHRVMFRQNFKSSLAGACDMEFGGVPRTTRSDTALYAAIDLGT